MSIFFLFALSTPTLILAEANILKYEAQILSYACITQQQGIHSCRPLPKKITETIEFDTDKELNEWGKWVKAQKFEKSYDFSVSLRLKRNSDQKSFTLSAMIANPWTGAFSLGETRTRIASIGDAPHEWMLGSSEVAVGVGKSYSARLILKKR